jgi:bacterioferritin
MRHGGWASGRKSTQTSFGEGQHRQAHEMLRTDLENEAETIRNYRERIKECETLGEYALSENIREILKQEQEHLIDLATALGIDVRT